MLLELAAEALASAAAAAAAPRLGSSVGVYVGCMYTGGCWLDYWVLVGLVGAGLVVWWLVWWVLVVGLAGAACLICCVAC
jgi:hypothetical protein